MGIFKSTHKALSAGFRTVGNGLTLLAEGASELEMLSHKFLQQTTIMSLEAKRRNLNDEWFAAENASQHQRLLSAYDELISILGEDKTPAGIENHRKLHQDLIKLVSDERLCQINKLEDQVSQSFNLAIDAIKPRKLLLDALNADRALHQTGADTPGSQKANERIQQLINELATLESQRTSEEKHFYKDGTLESNFKRIDGRIHGEYSEWHENGQRKWEVNFKAGVITGSALRYRSDGHKIFVFSKNHLNALVFSFFSIDGAEVATYRTGADTQLFEIHLDESLTVKINPRFGRRLALIATLLKAIFSPKFIAFIWRGRKPGVQQNRLKEVDLAVENIDVFSSELQSIRKKGVAQ